MPDTSRIEDRMNELDQRQKVCTQRATLELFKALGFLVAALAVSTAPLVFLTITILSSHQYPIETYRIIDMASDVLIIFILFTAARFGSQSMAHKGEAKGITETLKTLTK